jgi:hypothetical protein
MKIIKSDNATNILKQKWKDLRQIWIFDIELVCISQPELKAIIDAVWQKMKQDGEKLDCDEQALFLHAAVKKYWAVNFDGDEALAFGETAGTMFNGWPDIHNQNIAICEDGSIIWVRL